MATGVDSYEGLAILTAREAQLIQQSMSCRTVRKMLLPYVGVSILLDIHRLGRYSRLHVAYKLSGRVQLGECVGEQGVYNQDPQPRRTLLRRIQSDRNSAITR